MTHSHAYLSGILVERRLKIAGLAKLAGIKPRRLQEKLRCDVCTGSVKVLLPIDCDRIARALRLSPDDEHRFHLAAARDRGYKVFDDACV